MGAVPETIEVTVEIDPKNKKVVAVAMGSSELRTRDLGLKELSEEKRIACCAASLRVGPEDLEIEGRTTFLFALAHRVVRRRLFGFLSHESVRVRVIDREGTIRLKLSNALVVSTKPGAVRGQIHDMIERLTSFGDAGALVPDVFLLVGNRIVDFTGLIRESQIVALLDIELAKSLPDEDIALIASPKR